MDRDGDAVSSCRSTDSDTAARCGIGIELYARGPLISVGEVLRVGPRAPLRLRRRRSPPPETGGERSSRSTIPLSPSSASSIQMSNLIVGEFRRRLPARTLVEGFMRSCSRYAEPDTVRARSCWEDGESRSTDGDAGDSNATLRASGALALSWRRVRRRRPDSPHSMLCAGVCIVSSLASKKSSPLSGVPRVAHPP